ncbi:MAG TPA: hypothetical protein EYP10_10805 [Armatimonadetes bacterium]|nr:hypothetical protein [Armatimonadota bacterium]
MGKCRLREKELRRRRHRRMKRLKERKKQAIFEAQQRKREQSALSADGEHVEVASDVETSFSEATSE